MEDTAVYRSLLALNTACTIISCVVSSLAIMGHLKNYRKVSDQRLIVRILVMVPLFSISSWLALYSGWHRFNQCIVYLREVYEAFVIYTFYSLLMSLLGGEREIIFSTTGRQPIDIKPFALMPNLSIDISDPPTFLLLKRLVMQFVCIRPLVSPIMHLFPSLSLLWIIGYNISITLALNALMLFWVCLKSDLEPYRVVTKFLSVKLIVFFSYWQTLALTILTYVGIISSPQTTYTIENTLMCVETVGFAYLHRIAFPHSDYASTVVIGFSRVRLANAARDCLGISDLIHDFKSTFFAAKYGYRDFDSVESVLDHPQSRSRANRLSSGLRYRNRGRSKYWLPDKSLKKILETQNSEHSQSRNYGSVNDENREVRPASSDSSRNLSDEETNLDSSASILNAEDEWSDSEEQLYDQARKVYGDYNYPVVTVRPSEEYVSFQDRLKREQILSRI